MLSSYIAMYASPGFMLLSGYHMSGKYRVKKKLVVANEKMPLNGR